MNAEQKVKAAVEALVIDQIFYGTLIWATPIIAATHVRGHRIDTMATDNKAIYYNPAFVDTLTVGEVKGVLCHEIMHIANGHSLRRGSRDPFAWNVACDYAINPLILKGRMILPKDCLNDPKYSGMSAEEIYIREQAKPKPAPTPQQKAAQAPQKVGKGDDAEQGGDAPGEAQDEQQGDTGEDHGEPGQGKAEPSQDQGQGKPDLSKPGLVLDAVSEDGDPMTEAEKREAMADMRVQVIQAATLASKAGQDACTSFATTAFNGIFP
jgi:hypothetical protein